jgi:hypothetical protein
MNKKSKSTDSRYEEVVGAIPGTRWTHHVGSCRSVQDSRSKREGVPAMLRSRPRQKSMEQQATVVLVSKGRGLYQMNKRVESSKSEGLEVKKEGSRRI